MGARAPLVCGGVVVNPYGVHLLVAHRAFRMAGAPVTKPTPATRRSASENAYRVPFWMRPDAFERTQRRVSNGGSASTGYGRERRRRPEQELSRSRLREGVGRTTDTCDLYGAPSMCWRSEYEQRGVQERGARRPWWRTKLGRWAQPSMAAGSPCSRQRRATERS